MQTFGKYLSWLENQCVLWWVFIFVITVDYIKSLPSVAVHLLPNTKMFMLVFSVVFNIKSSVHAVL